MSKTWQVPHGTARRSARLWFVSAVALAAVARATAAAEGDATAALRAQGYAIEGRVAVRVAPPADAAQLERARAAAVDMLSADPAHPERFIHIAPVEDGPGRYELLSYDYKDRVSVRRIIDANAAELSRELLSDATQLGPGEFAEAVAAVARDSRWAARLAAGTLHTYEPMPPIITGADGSRIVNVGVAAPDMTRTGEGTNEIVGVLLPKGDVVTYPGGAPPSAKALAGTCGVTETACTPDTTSGGTYNLVWPATNPVWTMTVTRPRISTPQPNGSGIDLTNVQYKGRLLFARMHMPILNVQYTNDECGPYRDWLDSENCFQATGTTVAPGIRVASASPLTLCESGADTGAFTGVAIYDEGESIWLSTETSAGWYRYVMQWRFYADGRIQPVMGYGATQNSCVCFAHVHHGYWRFDLAPGGNWNGGSPVGDRIEFARGGPGASWTIHATERKDTRPTTNSTLDWWRIRNPNTGLGVVFQPGAEDRGAEGDAFAKGDYWALAFNGSQFSDGRRLGDGTDQSINIDSWINGESIAGSRGVFWYHAGFLHDVGGARNNEPCHLTGPMIHVTDGTGDNIARVTVEPATARILIDGVQRAVGEFVGVLPAGSYTVTIAPEAGYYDAQPKTLTVGPGAPPTLDFRLTSIPSGSMVY